MYVPVCIKFVGIWVSISKYLHKFIRGEIIYPFFKVNDFSAKSLLKLVKLLHSAMPIWLPIHELNLLYPGLANYWRCIAKEQDAIKKQ